MVLIDYHPFAARNLSFSNVHRRLHIFIAVGPHDVSMIAGLFVWFATVCAIFHVVFGGLDLSPLVFMDALESLNIFVRYAVSAVTCQIILWMQLVVVRHELRHQKP